jgi:hypothetical protein
MDGQCQAVIDSCIQQFRAGTLDEEKLRNALDWLTVNGTGHQDLLYLQAGSAAVSSQVVGMFTVEDGEIDEGPPDPDDWPYQSVLDALKDGWRIIKFPELALLLDDTKLHGPGVEFILERRR